MRTALAPSALDIERGALVFILYLGTALLGLSLSAVGDFAALIWPPTGIALAAVLLGGYRLLPSITLAAFAANLITGAPVIAAAGIALGNTLEALAGAFLLRRWGFRSTLDRLEDVLGLLLTAVLATIISPIIGLASLVAAGAIEPELIPTAWRAWWLGDALGMIVVASLILTWQRRPSWSGIRRALETVSLFAFLAAVGLTVFWTSQGPQSELAAAYLAFLPLLWAAVRFNQRTVATAAFALAALAAWGTLRGGGPFMGMTPFESLFGLQVFISVATATTMILAAAVSERGHVVTALQGYTGELERHRTSLELEMAKGEALLESLGEAILAVDQTGKISITNRAFDNLLGVKSGEVIGRDLLDVIDVYTTDGAFLERAGRPIFRALGGERVRINCYVARRAGAERIPVSVVASPLWFGGEVIGAVDVLHDIRREMEIDRAKSEFVSLASHQLRTPITAINWHLEAVINKNAYRKLRPKHRRYLRESHRATQRLLGMVGALLNISRIEANTFSIQPRPMHLGRLVASVIEEFSEEIEKKKLHVQTKLGAPLPAIPLDAGIMRMTIENLVSNAVKYTPPGGTIKITLKRNQADAVLTVADTGCGIPKADQGNVFSKFFRAQNVAQAVPDGNGLGLYIAKSILERAGGAIRFTSSEKRGTQFRISLPLSGMRSQEKSSSLLI